MSRFGEVRVEVAAWLLMVHVVIGNLETWIDEKFHAARKRHLQEYLSEVMLRFKGRFYRNLSFCSLLWIAVQQEAPACHAVYRRDWDRWANAPASPTTEAPMSHG